MKKQIKKWSGRFDEPVNKLVQIFTASVDFDKRLALYDIKGSLAHAEMLNKQKIITNSDFKKIQQGLNKIQNLVINNEFIWSVDDEDVHLNIEKKLTQLIGEAGKKLHTGRSRNDQVATDLRLFLRDVTDEVIEKIIQLNTAHCNTNSIAIAVGRDAQVAQALELGVIDKASDRSQEEKEE